MHDISKINEMSRNKSSFLTISAFVLASTAVKGCCRTDFKPVTKYTQLIYILLYMDMYIWQFVNLVTVFKCLVYSVNSGLLSHLDSLFNYQIAKALTKQEGSNICGDCYQTFCISYFVRTFKLTYVQPIHA